MWGKSKNLIDFPLMPTFFTDVLRALINTFISQAKPGDKEFNFLKSNTKLQIILNIIFDSMLKIV